MRLTERQLAAVEVREPPQDTCVVAGPGSGKTTVLVAYFERLVESGVDPLRILAITFTDKAANNMREKLAEAFRGRAEIRGKLERAYVSTVHGFCARLLKENAIFAGLDPEFYVMDERESLRAQKESVDEALDSLFVEQPERMRTLMRGLAAVDAGGEVLGVYEAIRAAGMHVADLNGFSMAAPADVTGDMEELRRQKPRDWKYEQLAHLDEAQDWAGRMITALPQGAEPALRAMQSFTCGLRKLKQNNRTYELIKKLKDESIPELEYRLITEYYAAGRAAIMELLARFDRLYREQKRKLGALDYNDLEEYAVRLLEEHPEVRQGLREQFHQVLMDEFQDTNGQQARLLELLRPPDRFYAVGDINQSIYGFRHANPDVFRDYRDEVERQGGRLVELIENFRSRPDILCAVEAVTNGAEGIVTRRLAAGLTFAEKAEPSVEVWAALAGDMDAALALEAQWIAARIAELQGSLQLRKGAAEFRDMAVLVRNSEVLGEFTRAFDDFGIPYLVNRGKGFYETREVVDLMHVLRVVANPRDEISMAAVLRSPFVEASDEALLRLRGLGNLGSAVEGLTEEARAHFGPDDAEKIARFRERLAGWRATRDHIGIDELLVRAMDECGYAAATEMRGTANIEKFLAQARAAGARQTLAQFVEEMELLRESKPREPDAPPEDSANAVKIMTVHSAKGLEFPVVFLAAMHKGIDANPGAIFFSPRIGLGARWHHPFNNDDKDDWYQHAIRQELKQREKEESHRLLYVAMTRAEEHLVMSLSSNRRKPQNWAALLTHRLRLDLETAGDQMVTVEAAGEGRARIRVRCVDTAPARPARLPREEAGAAVQVLDRPAVTEQHDSQATVTSVSMFADCARRYYLSRYLGFETRGRVLENAEAGSDLNATDLGKQVHALLSGVAVESPDPEAIKLASLFPKSPLGRRAGAANTKEREFDFLMEVENIVLRGQIDLWFEERGKLVLVDYKTDRVSGAEAPVRAARYALQLRLYGMALERLTGRAPDEAYLYFLRPNLAVPVDLRPSLFESPEGMVREFREAQERQQFPLREGEHCRTCPHFGGGCPAGAELRMRDVIQTSTVNGEGLGSDEAGVGRDQEGDRVGDVGGLAGTPQHGA